MKKYLVATAIGIISCIALFLLSTQIETGEIKELNKEEYNAYYIEKYFPNSDFFVYLHEDNIDTVTGYIQGEGCNEDMSEYENFYHKNIAPCSCFILTLPKQEWKALTKEKPYFSGSLYVTEVIIEKDGRYYGFTNGSTKKPNVEKEIKAAAIEIANGNVTVDNHVNMSKDDIKEYLGKYSFKKRGVE